MGVVVMVVMVVWGTVGWWGWCRWRAARGGVPPPYSPPPEKTATFSTTGGGSSAKAGPPCVCHAKPNVEPAVAPPSHARREDDADDDGGLYATAGFVSTNISAAPAYARRDAAAVDRRGRSWWAMSMTCAARSPIPPCQ